MPTTRSTRRPKAPEALAHDVLAYDELRTAAGDPLALFALGRAYHFVCPKRRQGHPNVQAFRTWIKQEVGALDWGKCANRAVHWAPVG